jgi:hypothetical protein
MTKRGAGISKMVKQLPMMVIVEVDPMRQGWM